MSLARAKNILVLTATVTPPVGAAQLARVDPVLRMNDYVKAFEFYLTQLASEIIAGIVFADNSNSDISVLYQIVEKCKLSHAVEFLSFDGLNYDPSYGRGYGEFKMLDYVMANSKLIVNAPTDVFIWKITGRYVLKNLEEVIKSKSITSDFYCHCRNIPDYWIDLYVLCWNKHAYREIVQGIFESLKESVAAGSAEPQFRRILDQKEGRIKIQKRFKTIPLLEGHRGLDNANYADQWLKLVVRKMALIFTPWLWI